MHSAPAVSYPVGRSRFQAQLVSVLAMLGGLTGLAWSLTADAPGWRQGVFFGVLLLVCGFSLWSWLRSPAGLLAWDGEAWRFSVDQRVFHGNLRLHLDLQFCMLLGFRSDEAGWLWLWPERRTAPAAWLALRRAVVANAEARGPDSIAEAASMIKP